MRLKRTLIALGGAVLVFGPAIYWGNDVLIALESDNPSISSGFPSEGSIQNSKRLPTCGSNFATYSRLCNLVGRNCVHDSLKAVILDAYSRLAAELPERRFIYGEMGWPHGGRFWPHATHENGLSADFLVPVNTLDGTPAAMLTHIFNKFGYGVRFDSTGATNSYRIDFDVMAAHLKAIHASATNHGLEIVVVTFDRAQQKNLFASKVGRDLRELMHFSIKPAGNKHNEHYHIDFAQTH